MTRKKSFRQHAGFTMLEVLAATIILSFAVIAVAEAVSVAQMQTYEALHNGRATALAEAYLEEVVCKTYVSPDNAVAWGPDPGQAAASGKPQRSAYQFIDDYNDYPNNLQTPETSLTDVSGKAYPSTYQDFSVNITTQFTTSMQLFASDTEPGNGINITVTVSDKTGRQWIATRFIPETGE
jgi:prepilin-type N-terminal cleavage/methylation domain-containing protein